MNRPLKLILPAAICLVTLITLYAFRTVPQSRLWKGWTLLYVTDGVMSEDEVSRVLAEKGCKGVISRSGQREPIVSPLSPIQKRSRNSYMQRREAFFSDEAASAMIFYVPDGQDAALSRALAELSQTVSCGTDSAASFPYLAPVFALLFAVCLVFFTRHRIHSILASLFLLALAFSRPMFTVTACVCLALSGLFLLEKLSGRKGALLRSVRSPLAVLLLVLPFFVLCASSPLNAVFYVLALSASVGAILLYEEIADVYYSRFPHAFQPVRIRSAFAVELVSSTDLRALVALTVSCILILCTSLLGSRVQASGSATNRPALPAPVARSDGNLPDLTDFLAWSWKTASFPYIKLDSKTGAEEAEEDYPEEGERVTVPSFVQQGDSLVENSETKLIYDAAFRESVYDAVRKAPYPALETMLLKQGKNARYAYVRGGTATAERLGKLLLSVCTVISLGLTLYFGGRRKYGFGK